MILPTKSGGKLVELVVTSISRSTQVKKAQGTSLSIPASEVGIIILGFGNQISSSGSPSLSCTNATLLGSIGNTGQGCCYLRIYYKGQTTSASSVSIGNSQGADGKVIGFVPISLEHKET